LFCKHPDVRYSLEFGGDAQDLTMTLVGEVDAPGIQGLIHDLMAHPEFREGLRILVDLSELDTSSITAEQYESVSHVITGRDHRFPAQAIAIVAPAARTFEDAVRHRAYVGGSKSQREVFRTREDATAWLAAQKR
jgi:hypothetical protein